LNSKGRAVAARAKTGRGLTAVPIFLLVPQVKLPKRLDLARDAESVADGVPGAACGELGQWKVLMMALRDGARVQPLERQHPALKGQASCARNFEAGGKLRLTENSPILDGELELDGRRYVPKT
jgi:hypothetical protein